MIIELLSLSIFIPLITGFIYWKRLDKFQKAFLWFIGFSVLIEAMSFYAKIQDIENHLLFKLFLIGDLLFFIWFFNKTNLFPRWQKWATGLFLFFGAVWETLIRTINHEQKTESLFYIFIFLYFVIQSSQVLLLLFNNLESSPIKNYLFWIASARLMYYSFILFIYLYPNLRINSFNNSAFALAFIVINTSANVLCNIMYGISLYERK